MFMYNSWPENISFLVHGTKFTKSTNKAKCRPNITKLKD